MWKQLFQMDHKWEPGEKRKEHFKNPFKKPYLRLEGFFFSFLKSLEIHMKNGC